MRLQKVNPAEEEKYFFGCSNNENFNCLFFSLLYQNNNVMSDINLLVTQIKRVHNWTWKLIENIPSQKWLTTPEVIESNIHWQVGHLIITHFYHTIVCLKKADPDIFQMIPIMEYYPFFSAGSIVKESSNFAVEELRQNLLKVQNKEVEIFQSLSPEDLSENLFPTQFPHPVAKSKLEAIYWDVEHTMWHCGQIALIKRVVDERYTFS